MRRLLQLRVLRHELRLDWVRHGDGEDLVDEHEQRTEPSGGGRFSA